MRQSDLGEHESADPEKPWRGEDWLRDRWYSCISTEQIADEAGCATPTIQKWGRRKFGFKSRKDIATKPHQDPDELRRLYHGEKMTVDEVASEFNTDHDTIRYWMKKHDIPRRSARMTKLLQDPGVGFSHADSMGYEQVQHTVDGQHYVVQVHRLCAIAWFGIDAVKDNDTHHKNGVKWDNREENLEVMGTTEHRQHHYAEREIDDDGRFV